MGTEIIVSVKYNWILKVHAIIYGACNYIAGTNQATRLYSSSYELIRNWRYVGLCTYTDINMPADMQASIQINRKVKLKKKRTRISKVSVMPFSLVFLSVS